jgi:hypothetical protein
MLRRESAAFGRRFRGTAALGTTPYFARQSRYGSFTAS